MRERAIASFVWVRRMMNDEVAVTHGQFTANAV
jgi:hypothetical protein